MNRFTSLVRRLFSARLVKSHNKVRVVPPSTPLRIELLEDRAVPAAFGYRSIDGTGNNLVHLGWGAAGTDFIRVAAAQYADGISTPAGATRPSARAISNAVSDQGGDATPNDRFMSAMVYAWGQFIDHDMNLSNTGSGQRFDIAVPTGDAYFDPNSTGTKVIPLTRTSYDPTTGTSSARQQINAVTAWLDGSMIYGSDATTAASLRSFQGGKLKTSTGELLPTDSKGSFLAGDSRVNENPELTSLQTLFVREHNRKAEQLAKANPRFSDEQLYQQAKEWVTAELQAITYNEWLPAMLGQGLSPYRGYNVNINGAASNEFAAAGFRMGHSLLGDDIEFLDNNGKPITEAVSLADAFFNPQLVKANGIDPLLKYLASDPSSEVDTKVVDSVRNFLFGAPGSGGFDLASLNIQRGRDHGLADYNTTRVAYGLPRITSFGQITSNMAMQAKLKALYRTVDNIDLWVGTLAEDHVRGGSVGATTRAILLDQFSRLRDGDRFWYQREFSGRDLRELDNTRLSDLIRRNSTISNVQQNAFFFRADITGRVVTDSNHNGQLDLRDLPAAGVALQLWNVLENQLVATVMTDANGFYHFGVAEGLRTGEYQVRVTGSEPKSSGTLAVTRGDTLYRGIDFLLSSPSGRAPRLAGGIAPPRLTTPNFLTFPILEGLIADPSFAMTLR